MQCYESTFTSGRGVEWEVGILRKRSLDWGQQRNPLNKNASLENAWKHYKQKLFDKKNDFPTETPIWKFTDPCLKTLVLNHYTIHVICGSINAFPSSYIRSPWHRFMSEKGPRFKLAQVWARHPPTPLTFLSDLWKRIQTWHWARDILQGCIQAKEISTGHRMWPKPFAPSFLHSFFFHRSIKFPTIWAGRAEGSWWGL